MQVSFMFHVIFMFLSLYIYDLVILEPWQHLMMGLACGYIGYNFYTWEDNLMLKVNAEREKRGFAPIERVHLIPSGGVGPIEFEDKKTAPHN